MQPASQAGGQCIDCASTRAILLEACSLSSGVVTILVCVTANSRTCTRGSFTRSGDVQALGVPNSLVAGHLEQHSELLHQRSGATAAHDMCIALQPPGVLHQMVPVCDPRCGNVVCILLAAAIALSSAPDIPEAMQCSNLHHCYLDSDTCLVLGRFYPGICRQVVLWCNRCCLG